MEMEKELLEAEMMMTRKMIVNGDITIATAKETEAEVIVPDVMRGLLANR